MTMLEMFVFVPCIVTVSLIILHTIRNIVSSDWKLCCTGKDDHTGRTILHLATRRPLLSLLGRRSLRFVTITDSRDWEELDTGMRPCPSANQILSELCVKAQGKPVCNDTVKARNNWRVRLLKEK